MKLLRHDNCRDATNNGKLERNRPRFGEIARESGQKHEEDARNPKKAPTGPENSVPGSFFAFFGFRWGGHFSEISWGRQKASFHDLFVHMFSCMLSVFHFFVHLPYGNGE